MKKVLFLLFLACSMASYGQSLILGDNWNLSSPYIELEGDSVLLLSNRDDGANRDIYAATIDTSTFMPLQERRVSEDGLTTLWGFIDVGGNSYAVGATDDTLHQCAMIFRMNNFAINWAHSLRAMNGTNNTTNSSFFSEIIQWGADFYAIGGSRNVNVGQANTDFTISRYSAAGVLLDQSHYDTDADPNALETDGNRGIVRFGTNFYTCGSSQIPPGANNPLRIAVNRYNNTLDLLGNSVSTFLNPDGTFYTGVMMDIQTSGVAATPLTGLVQRTGATGNVVQGSALIPMANFGASNVTATTSRELQPSVAGQIVILDKMFLNGGNYYLLGRLQVSLAQTLPLLVVLNSNFGFLSAYTYEGSGLNNVRGNLTDIIFEPAGTILLTGDLMDANTGTNVFLVRTNASGNPLNVGPDCITATERNITVNSVAITRGTLTANLTNTSFNDDIIVTVTRDTADVVCGRSQDTCILVNDASTTCYLDPVTGNTMVYVTLTVTNNIPGSVYTELDLHGLNTHFDITPNPVVFVTPLAFGQTTTVNFSFPMVGNINNTTQGIFVTVKGLNADGTEFCCGTDFNIDIHCEGCAIPYNSQIECDPVTGGYTLATTVENTSGFTVDHIFVSNVTPVGAVVNLISIAPPLPLAPGDTTRLTFDVTGVPSGTLVNFVIELHDIIVLPSGDTGTVTCCHVHYSIETPNCGGNVACQCDPTEMIGILNGIQASLVVGNCSIGVGLPTLGQCDDLTIDWGDGTIDQHNIGGVSYWHTYVTNGVYVVMLTLTRTLPNGQRCTERITFDAPCNGMPRIAPNPAQGDFNVYLGEVHATRIEVVSTIGQLMQAANLDPERTDPTFHVDAQNFPPGLYLVKIYAQEQIFEYKVIVQ